ncbi:histidine phosphatase family protein [Dysgonomonas capnocytophagoides]|uniref:histidine phosphatase family protein n=1 Tax=Dysgonomonas capnocytophagoides TaxID=45254 RepID=UPI00291DAAFF|nr:histidine-type phosphatase [Dysgonomonas capnocytophagoides]
MRKILALFVLCVPLITVSAQTSLQEITETPQKSGGVLYAYPFKGENYTAPPKGYEAFYISHFGRHGSRYLINDDEYKWPLELLESASAARALTPLGEDVLGRLKQVWEEARGRGGDLSPLGVRQHRGIAERMYNSYPQIFDSNLDISARSTLVTRCILSMDAFCERLKELNPGLNISRNASHRHMPDICPPYSPEAETFRSAKDTWREEYRKFEESHIKPERLVNSLFSDKTFITEKVNPSALMKALGEIAGSVQNMEVNVSFYDIFTTEELFDIWQCKNYHNYVVDGPSSKSAGATIRMINPLLKDIMDKADDVIQSKGKGATLRFGHDGNLIPLLALMHVQNCYESISNTTDFYKVWSNFKTVPMASNIQIVFYRKSGSDDILVKFLHNEKEVLITPVKSDIPPFYKWKDVENFYSGLLK